MITDKLRRLHIHSTEDVGWATKVLATFEYPDIRGETVTGAAKLLLPPKGDTFPLYYQCGYELSDERLRSLVAFGFMVVNPIPPPQGWSARDHRGINRSINLDVALLHIARSLNCVDDTRVAMGGASGGGTFTWMLTAETFPLSGSLPEAAQVNTGYNAWYRSELQRLQQEPGTPELPAIRSSWQVIGASVSRHDSGSDVWFQHSPVAHADAVSSPVQLLHATSDLLNPVEQIARRLRREPVDLPPSYTTNDGRDWVFLEDVFPDMHIEMIDPPAGAPLLEIDADRFDGLLSGRSRMANVSATATATKPRSSPVQHVLNLPAPKARIVACIIDDGGPGPRVGHFRSKFTFSHGAFLAKVLAKPVDAPAQWTEGKRRVLEARARGEEWIKSHFRHLDFPAAEEADLERALAYL